MRSTSVEAISFVRVSVPILDHIAELKVHNIGSEKRDSELLDFYASDDVATSIANKLDDSYYKQVVLGCDILTIDGERDLKKHLYKFIMYQREMVDESVEQDPIYALFVKDLYCAHSGRNKDLRALYDSVTRSIYSWDGMFGEQLICLDDSNDKYSIVEHLSIKPHLMKTSPEDEVLRFLPTIAIRYRDAKQLRNEKGMFAPGGHDDHTDVGLKTSERNAQEIGKSERYVRRAEDFADGLDIADEIIPGTKEKVLNGEVKVQHWDVESLRLSALDDRPEKVKSMFNKDAQPYDERKTTEMIIDGPLHGAILQLVGSLGNYFARFPMIMSDENFRKDVRAEFEQLKKYIAECEDFLDEGERKSQANIPDSNEALPQINTDL